jgi:hypothetical protein
MKQSKDNKNRRLPKSEIGVSINKLADMLWHTASELTGKSLDIGEMFKELDIRLELADIYGVDIEFRSEKPADDNNSLEAITSWHFLGLESEMPYIARFEYTASTENPKEKKVVLVFVPHGYIPDVR